MSRELIISQSVINDDSDCYIIAEIGHNHQGNLQKAKELFRAAKEAGVDAVKLQKRENRSLYTREMYNKSYENRNSYGETYGQHREFLEFGWEQYVELQKYAKELTLDFFATAFDIPSAQFLSKLDPPAYKIASGDITTIPLLKHVASLGKPMIISTGAATMSDVRRAYEAIMPINKNLCILHCTAAYPPEWNELNLKVIETFRQEFPDIVIGLSSHDSGIAMAVGGYVLGARIIEKHFTLNRAMKGTDHAFSLEPAGMKKMVRDLRRLRLALGDGKKMLYENERAPGIKMGKSLVAAKNLKKGYTLTEKDIAMKCPGGGIAPYELERLIGMTLVKDVTEDEAFSFDVVRESSIHERSL
jgi:sialic acid synthase